ncbi:hypothetical protein CDD83_11224 [Cordyceps sp. RAO-2017]|nr:hypothetical protein CDD83_11224 [Cordyceps sp. RAO-2017]
MPQVHAPTASPPLGAGFVTMEFTGQGSDASAADVPNLKRRERIRAAAAAWPRKNPLRTMAQTFHRVQRLVSVDQTPWLVVRARNWISRTKTVEGVNELPAAKRLRLNEMKPYDESALGAGRALSAEEMAQELTTVKAKLVEGILQIPVDRFVREVSRLRRTKPLQTIPAKRRIDPEGRFEKDGFVMGYRLRAYSAVWPMLEEAAGMSDRHLDFETASLHEIAVRLGEIQNSPRIQLAQQHEDPDPTDKHGATDPEQTLPPLAEPSNATGAGVSPVKREAQPASPIKTPSTRLSETKVELLPACSPVTAQSPVKSSSPATPQEDTPVPRQKIVSTSPALESPAATPRARAAAELQASSPMRFNAVAEASRATPCPSRLDEKDRSMDMLPPSGTESGHGDERDSADDGLPRSKRSEKTSPLTYQHGPDAFETSPLTYENGPDAFETPRSGGLADEQGSGQPASPAAGAPGGLQAPVRGSSPKEQTRVEKASPLRSSAVRLSGPATATPLHRENTIQLARSVKRQNQEDSTPSKRRKPELTAELLRAPEYESPSGTFTSSPQAQLPKLEWFNASDLSTYNFGPVSTGFRAQGASEGGDGSVAPAGSDRPRPAGAGKADNRRISEPLLRSALKKRRPRPGPEFVLRRSEMMAETGSGSAPARRDSAPVGAVLGGEGGSQATPQTPRSAATPQAPRSAATAQVHNPPAPPQDQGLPLVQAYQSARPTRAYDLPGSPQVHGSPAAAQVHHSSGTPQEHQQLSVVKTHRWSLASLTGLSPGTPQPQRSFAAPKSQSAMHPGSEAVGATPAISWADMTGRLDADAVTTGSTPQAPNPAGHDQRPMSIDMRQNRNIFDESSVISPELSPSERRRRASRQLARLAEDSCAGLAKVVVSEVFGRFFVRFKLPMKYAGLFPQPQGFDESQSLSPPMCSSPRLQFSGHVVRAPAPHAAGRLLLQAPVDRVSPGTGLELGELSDASPLEEDTPMRESAPDDGALKQLGTQAGEPMDRSDSSLTELGESPELSGSEMMANVDSPGSGGLPPVARTLSPVDVNMTGGLDAERQELVPHPAAARASLSASGGAAGPGTPGLRDYGLPTLAGLWGTPEHQGGEVSVGNVVPRPLGASASPFAQVPQRPLGASPSPFARLVQRPIAPVQETLGRAFVREFKKRSKPKGLSATETGSPVGAPVRRLPLGAKDPNVVSPQRGTAFSGQGISEPESQLKRLYQGSPMPQPLLARCEPAEEEMADAGAVDEMAAARGRDDDEDMTDAPVRRRSARLHTKPEEPTVLLRPAKTLDRVTKENTARNRGGARLPRAVLASASRGMRMMIDQEPIGPDPSPQSKGLKSVGWKDPLEAVQQPEKRARGRPPGKPRATQGRTAVTKSRKRNPKEKKTWETDMAKRLERTMSEPGPETTGPVVAASMSFYEPTTTTQAASEQTRRAEEGRTGPVTRSAKRRERY